MGERMTAVWRILGLVYLVTIYPFIAGIVILGALLFMVVDVPLQLLRGDGASSSGMLSNIGMRAFNYPVDQAKFVILGEGDFPILP